MQTEPIPKLDNKLRQNSTNQGPFTSRPQSSNSSSNSSTIDLSKSYQELENSFNERLTDFDNWAKKCYFLTSHFEAKMEQLENFEFFASILKANNEELSISNSAIDDSVLFSFFQKISQNPSFSLFSSKTVPIIVQKLNSFKKSQISYMELRGICILLYIPTLYQNTRHLNTIIRIIGGFINNPKNIFINWMTNLPHLISRLVGGCHSLIDNFYENSKVLTNQINGQKYIINIYPNNSNTNISSAKSTGSLAFNAFSSDSSQHVFPGKDWTYHVGPLYNPDTSTENKGSLKRHFHIFKTLEMCFQGNECCKYQLPISAFYNQYIDKRSNIFPTVFPFILSFETRIHICKSHTREHQITSEVDCMIRGKDGKNRIFIRRESYYEDFKRHFSQVKPSIFYRRLKVTFCDEVAIDAGGPQKECMRLVTEALREKTLRLVNKRLFWFKKLADSDLNDLRLLGIAIGLSIANEITLPIRFPRVFYLKLLKSKRKPSIKDFEEFNPTVALSLSKLIDMKNKSKNQNPIDQANNIETISLTFQITNDEGEDIDLIPNGSEIAVTNDNVEQFVDAYINYEINIRYQKQFESFQHGFELSCPSSYFYYIAAEELDVIVSGIEEYDWGALATGAKYLDGLEPSSDEVRWFWEVFWDISNEKKQQFLKFTTGTDRAPFGGLRKIHLKFRKGGKYDKLPVAHTCFNMFLLPKYRSKEELKAKLFLALEYSEGFGIE